MLINYQLSTRASTGAPLLLAINYQISTLNSQLSTLNRSRAGTLAL
ncbi:MAG: hypothetical protein ACRC62_19070 [Microcoleus sp.]